MNHIISFLSFPTAKTPELSKKLTSINDNAPVSCNDSESEAEPINTNETVLNQDSETFTSIKGTEPNAVASSDDRESQSEPIITNYSEMDKEIACIKMQSQIRRYHLLHSKETPVADVNVLKDSKGKAVGYEIEPETGNSFPYKALPPKLDKSLPYKRNIELTHQDSNSKYVGLTLLTAEKTTSKDVIEVINKLPCMPVQFRINDTIMMSTYLGAQNLELQIESKNYNCLLFKSLAENLDTLHSQNYVHRNIKPQNMFHYQERIVLSGHDLAGKVGSFTDDRHTPNYVPLEFQTFIKDNGDNQDRTESINPYKKDQYAFFISMMQAKFQQKPQNGLFVNHAAKVTQFVNSLPCGSTKKKELSKFLNDPVKNQITEKLSTYLENGFWLF